MSDLCKCIAKSTGKRCTRLATEKGYCYQHAKVCDNKIVNVSNKYKSPSKKSPKSKDKLQKKKTTKSKKSSSQKKSAIKSPKKKVTKSTKKTSNKPRKNASTKKSKYAHPSYKEMIARAIIAAKERKGSSRVYIKKYVETNWKVPENYKLNLNKTLTKMVINGELLQTKGKYRCSKELKDKY